MHTNAFFSSYLSQEESSNQAALIELELVEAQQPESSQSLVTKFDGVSILNSILFLLPVASIIILLIVDLRVSVAFWKVVQGKTNSVEDCSQIPCKNCQFFTNNPYLKCAVNPSAVLTKQAIDCSDYSPQN